MSKLTKQKKEYELGDYIIKQTLGQGTFGKVKLGIYKSTNKKVAIKILDKSRIVEKDDQERVNRELKIISNFKHPNVIQVKELLQTHKYYFIVMEYCEGGELFHYIVKKRNLSEEETSFFFYQIINGLEYIHSDNVVHRDLKPENLLITKEYRLKIIDFGLSNYFNKTLLTTPCGSPCYASPEMVLGKKYNGFMIDIWSVGIILYAMICGYLPFEDKENKVLFKMISECKIVFPHHVSHLVKDIIHKILVTDPYQRITLKNIKRHPFYLKGQSFYQSRFGEEESEDSLNVKALNVPISYKAYNTEGCLESFNSNKEQHTLKKETEVNNINIELFSMKETKQNNKKNNNNNEYQGLLTDNYIISPLRKRDKSKSKEKQQISLQTMPNQHINLEKKQIKPITQSNNGPVSFSKPKNNIKISTIRGIHSMRYPLYASLLKKQKPTSNQNSKHKNKADITSRPQITQKINNITIKTASININMIEPNIIINKANKCKNRELECSSLSDKKDIQNWNNKSAALKTKKINITLNDLFKRDNDKINNKSMPSTYADSVVKTQENTQLKTQFIYTLNRGINHTMSLSNRKKLSNFLEKYHPIRALEKSYIVQENHQHNEINSLKLSDFYSPQKKIAANNAHYAYVNKANVSYKTNSIGMNKNRKEIDKSWHCLPKNFEKLYYKHHSSVSNQKGNK